MRRMAYDIRYVLTKDTGTDILDMSNPRAKSSRLILSISEHSDTR